MRLSFKPNFTCMPTRNLWFVNVFSTVRRQNNVVKIGSWSGSRWRRGPSHGTTSTMVNPALGNVSVLCVVDVVIGVTQLHDVVYMVCQWSSAIMRFNATTHQRLKDIDIKGMSSPLDIVSCERTSQLYVAGVNCVLRVSSDGRYIQHWLPEPPDDTFKPWSLSVMTSTHLLVTSRNTRQLRQFDTDGINELRRRRVQLPDHMEPRHAVASPTGTFIVGLYNTQLGHCQVVEVNTGRHVLRQLSGSHLTSLSTTLHVAVDSRGNIFVADHDNRHILLLDNHLSLRRVIIDEHQLNYMEPRRLCYREDKGQLLVALGIKVVMFDVLCR